MGAAEISLSGRERTAGLAAALFHANGGDLLSDNRTKGGCTKEVMIRVIRVAQSSAELLSALSHSCIAAP